MDIINFFVNLLSDPRGAIAGWIIALGPLWVYSPLFLIVFVETGLVFFPFCRAIRCCSRRACFSADGGGLNVWATLIVFLRCRYLGQHVELLDRAVLRRAHHRFRQSESAHA